MAAAASGIAASVKDTLVGTDQPPSITAESRRTFDRFAQQADAKGERWMTPDGFIDAMTLSNPDEDFHKIKREQYGILFQAADRQRRGKLTMGEWTVFTNLLAKPDAEYEIAFRLFDVEGTGKVEYDTFTRILKENQGPDSIPFNWESKWSNLYVGQPGNRHTMTYTQFAQMLRGLQGERVRQAFQYFDRDNNGYIEPDEFATIIQRTAAHKLSDHLLENLQTLCNLGESSKISYSTVRAFSNLIREADMVDNIVRVAVGKSPDGNITKTDFLIQASRMTRYALFTPMEVEILFHFAGLDNPSGRLGLEDFNRVFDPSWQDRYSDFGSKPLGEKLADAAAAPSAFLGDLVDGIYHFALGAVAGGFGASVVYPIDLVKTRMQNQRSAVVGQLLYKNSLDCFKKVIRNEGFKGLYSGLGPQLIGVAPEKAIKLTVNDLIRGRARKDDGSITLPWEILAGGMAGGCQVIFTNPLEIVKIRLQVQGELAKNVAGVPRRSALWIVKSLGLLGLYKGASACLMRDIPFSAIYFPTYAHLKKDYFGESPTKSLGILQLLTAGAIAGMPAAYLTTPADVIKTRLQVEARKGDTNYRGITHAFSTILREEGPKALFKGGPARILRSSPQFGATLAAYEFLQRSFPLHPTEALAMSDGTGAVTGGAAQSQAPLPYLRSRNALKIILDLDVNWGNYKNLKAPPVLGQ
ncbi:putative mitochondrial carrier protein [Protomyces lactucae-debilis]|uniref:Mitochondrial aspartate-glutamate transporter AGC1 n=1 Tax=Protomyces lactucae-debilis TaxID=2754530 RepID=A0A1Y2FBM4_PROLT|nr:putative mitochondrial carrier protein [Protomyces lactucae-debilis]ORY80844.1 putative mitochondrial carrier protein [Protomyces lactucae-debilis]